MGHISGANSGNLDLKKRINELEAEVEELNSKISPNFMALYRYSHYEFPADAITELVYKIYQDESLIETLGIISGVFIGGYPFIGTYYRRDEDLIVEFEIFGVGHQGYTVDNNGDIAKL
jgi:hypothetical protein